VSGGHQAPLRGCFVTATDTGVGKTVVAAARVAAARAARGEVRVRKPVLTGLDQPQDGTAPDHELLASVGGEAPAAVSPARYGPAVSPHLAAELAGRPLDIAALIADVRAAGTVVVEGIGGLLVPLAEGWDVRRLARELGLGVVIAARPGLGTINHTLLTIEAARAAGLSVAAVVLTPWPAEPSEMERSNRETIALLGEIEVTVLPTLRRPDLAELERLGGTLHWRGWLADRSHG
jgi:dethiobiotin synthetase